MCEAVGPGAALADTTSFQDIVGEIDPGGLPKVTIFTAREVVTLDPDRPTANAVAVLGNRILAVGTPEELKASVNRQPFTVDDTFADKVITPGFIAQHDHPLLSGLTMTSEIIAIEDWVLPSGTVPAARDHDDYMKRLTAAEAKLGNPNQVLLTWGYHPAFHGDLSRADLDKISATRPVVVWHRSAHDFTMNSKALATYGIDQAFVDAMPPPAKQQSDLDKGYFREAGMFAILPRLLPAIATPDRLQKGLQFVVEYFHANGVTLGSEPGGSIRSPCKRPRTPSCPVPTRRSATISFPTANRSSRLSRTPRSSRRRRPCPGARG